MHALLQSSLPIAAPSRSAPRAAAAVSPVAFSGSSPQPRPCLPMSDCPRARPSASVAPPSAAQLQLGQAPLVG
eukprot:11247158-Alexandrium_andersonii.AAC.1